MYLGFQGLRALAQRLPLSVVQWLGRALGVVAHSVLWSYRRLTTAHLDDALGESLTPSQRRRIARGVFTNLGQTALEWLWLPRLPGKDLPRLIVTNGVEHLRGALAKKNGAIIVSAHFGNWELIAPYLVSLGFQGGVLARRLRYPEYESFLISMRGGKGVPTLARGALKDVARLLHTNQVIGMMPDQDVDSLEGVYVNFFGRPAYTPVGPAALSLMSGAPILPCFIIRERGRFRLTSETPVRIPEVRDRSQALVLLTQAWSDVVESYIRRYPDHWVWMHRRWKTQRPLASRAISASEVVPMEGVRPGAVRPVAPLVMALATWAALASLVAGGCAKSTTSTGAEGAQRLTAAQGASLGEHQDQAIDGFDLASYTVDGTKRWELTGQGATVEGHLVTIHHPDGVGYDGAQTAYLTASAATMDQTNQHVRMEHEVTIHTEDGLWLTAPVLHWIPNEGRMATDTPVRIEKKHMVVWGRGLEAIKQMQQATLLEDVEMVLNPSDEDPPGARSHVRITCDGPLTFDYEQNIATFKDNVHVIDPSGEIFSDRLIAYLEPTTNTIRYAEAIGHVRIQQQQNTAYSERAVYEPAIGKITLVGQPSLIIYPSEEEPNPSADGTTAALPTHEPGRGSP